MSYRAEDKLRAVLTERADPVDTTPGWLGRVVNSGRRRRRRRRISFATVLVAIVALVTYIFAPEEWWAPILPPEPSVPLIDLSGLPEGGPLGIPHASGDGSAEVVALPTRIWESEGIVDVLERAGDGVVAVVERETGLDTDQPEYHLVYLDGARTVEIDTGEPATAYIRDVAVSADGTRVAWSSSGAGSKTLHLASLPDGELIAGQPVAALPGITVAAFVENKVLLTYDRDTPKQHSAEVWDPESNTIEPFFDSAGDGTDGMIVGISPETDTLLVVEQNDAGKECVHSRSLDAPTASPRWERCDFAGGAATVHLSPDGKSFALVHNRTDGAEERGIPEPDEVRIGDAATGKYTANRRIDADYVTDVLWEDAGTVVIRHAQMPDPETGTMIISGDEATRCSSSLRHCERLPGPVDASIGAIASEPGTGMPIRR